MPFTANLKEIEILGENELFSVIDETLFVTKSDRSLKDFDVLIVCLRDAENVKIPSSIKVINKCAFCHCNKLTTMAFEGDSSLETIDEEAISFNHSLKSIVFPPSVKYVNKRGFGSNYNLESVEFLGDYVKIAAYNFQCSSEGMVLSFPNAKKLEFDKDSMRLLPEGSKVKIRRGAELIGEEFSKIESKIEFIENNESRNQKVYTSSEKVFQEIKNTKIEKEEEFSIERSSIKNKSEQEYSDIISRCMKRIRFLESRLGKHEEVFPFDMNCEMSDEEVESETKDKETDSEAEIIGRGAKNIFIDEEEESQKRVICQIGEGATSVTYHETANGG